MLDLKDERTRDDLRSLMKLTAEQRLQLARTVERFEPSSVRGLRPVEAEKLAALVGIGEREIECAMRTLSGLESSDLDEIGRLERPDIPPGSHAVLGELLPVAQKLSQRLSILNEFAMAMASFVDSSLSTDLRLLQDGQLLPVAIIRLVLDEGDDAIFQCTIDGLKKLQGALAAALEQLEGLRARVPLSSQEGVRDAERPR